MMKNASDDNSYANIKLIFLEICMIIGEIF